LSVQNVGTGDSANYFAVVSNPYGSVTSSVANINVFGTNTGANITCATIGAAGTDWETTTNWSDSQAASVSAAQSPGNTYEVLVGARLRSPVNPTVATFPGRQLTLDGNGIFTNLVANLPGAPVAEFRFKQPTYGSVQGTVIFPKLIMNGGQLDNGADSGGGVN